MTLRECAIKAMKELNYSEERIASVLEHMDSDDPDLIGKDPAQLSVEDESIAISAARNYFRKNSAIPMDN